ncbi:acyl-CoA-binding domain-containing protein 6 isoform X6 [Chroicocephalus ridibundus]|uniref:acyl-CoA-binding domain-containing protein 6 isoform X6 n=1 Tax=Chroicocephalus ridibundus TaxID=1192867 RepID=UPI002FDDA9A9
MSRSGQRPLRNPRARCAFPAGQPVRAYRGVRGTGAAADLGGRRAAMASPPLVAAGAGSGGEASSGSEETGTAAPPGRDLAALFEQAAERLPALLPAASKEQLLYLYARYKQVKFGTCNTPKPSFFDFEGKQKWEAWKALGDISPHQAMQEYIATVKKLDPSWNPQTAEKRGKESKTAFGGPVVSSLYQEETIREEDKNIFDYCRENNIDYVTKAIRSKKVDVNVTDEEQRRGPWAGCFRPARGMSFWGLGDLGSIENLTLNCVSRRSQKSRRCQNPKSMAGLCSTGRATEDTRSWFQYCYSMLLTLTARTGKARLHSITLPPASFWILWNCC